MQIVPLLRRQGSATWRHRGKAALLAWVACVVGWAAVYLLPNQYQSGARLFVDTDAVLALLLRGIAIDSSPVGQVEVLQRTLLSRPNMEKVVAKTDLDLRVDSPATRELLLQRLARDIHITPQTKNLFTLEYRDPDPRIARDVVRTTLDLFIESATGNDRQQIENARQFLGQQISSYEVKLRDAERRRAEFQARYIDLLPSEALGGASRLEAARARQQQLQGERQDTLARRALLEAQLQAAPQTVVVGTEGGGAGGGSRTADAERALRELRLRYTDQHPDVRAAQAAMTELRATGGGGGGAPRSAARPVTRANPLYEQFKLRMVDLDGQLASLERQVRDGEADVARLDAVARGVPEVQAEFVNLDRDYNVLRKNYEELLARREAIQISDAARTGSDRVKLEVVDPPTLPTMPVSPPRKLLISAVLVAGMGAGLALAVLLAQLDGSFYTVHDLRRLNLPVLGGLSSATPLRRHLGALAGFCAAFGLLLLAYGAVLANPDHAPAFLSDAVRLIRSAA